MSEEGEEVGAEDGDEELVEAAVEVAPGDPELLKVIEKSRETTKALIGTKLDAITIKSVDPAEAPLLGANVSKLSPMTSTLLEHRVVLDLAKATDGGRFQIERQDPGFPDAGVFLDGLPTGHGLELKAHNVLSTEITGRFRASQLALEGKLIYVVIIAWVMDKIIHGQPLILDIEFVDALDVARYRDEHYNNPPQYLVSPPDDNEGRIASMLLRNVEGYVLQPSNTESDLAKVKLIQDALLAQADVTKPHHEHTAELTRHLRANLNYRLDTNFAKIDRIDHPQIEDFKKRNLDREYLGHSFREWRKVLKDIKSADAKKRARALDAVEPLYQP